MRLCEAVAIECAARARAGAIKQNSPHSIVPGIASERRVESVISKE